MSALLYVFYGLLLALGSGLVFLALLKFDPDGWRELRGQMSEKWMRGQK